MRDTVKCDKIRKIKSKKSKVTHRVSEYSTSDNDHPRSVRIADVETA